MAGSIDAGTMARSDTMEHGRRKLDALEEAIAQHEPQRVALDGEPMRAAVAMIFEPRDDDLHLFFIHRAEFAGDPWSGHMGFPGGRKDPEDRDVLRTALREVREEVGIDLDRQARLLAPLDEIQGVARGRQLPLVISPFAFVLEAPVELCPNHEVQSTLWVPHGFLADRRNQSEMKYRVDDHDVYLPAYVFQDRTIWGLTFRMVQSLLDLLVCQKL